MEEDISEQFVHSATPKANNTIHNWRYVLSSFKDNSSFSDIIGCYGNVTICTLTSGITICPTGRGKRRIQYSGRKITESVGKVAVRGGKRWKE
jgi:hypothetical protein